MYSGSMPQVNISEDLMTVTMLAEEPAKGESYTPDYIKDVLRINNIKIGILDDAVRYICGGGYNEPVVIAKGEEAANGTDGYYEYFFERALSSKPLIKEDGTADYHNIKMIELVKAGQEIAVYHPATKGSNGYNVHAKFILAIPGKDQPKLRGSGFEAQDAQDGTIRFVATIDGKIMENNGRITIKAVHEINGDLDLSQGNIEFNGDVIIHGRVRSGMEIKAEGTVTVDGVVEAATIYGKKGVILKSGVVGSEGSVIDSKGDITARFVEYAKVSCGGNMEAEAFLDSDVTCDGTIVLDGKKSSVVGGHIHANMGMKLVAVGNDTEVATTISVGLPKTLIIHAEEIRTRLKDEKIHMRKIDDALTTVETMAKADPENTDLAEKRQLLAIEHIRAHAIIAGDEDELKKIDEAKLRAQNATIEVRKDVFPGIIVGMGSDKVMIKEQQKCVEFRREGGNIKMFSMAISAG